MENNQLNALVKVLQIISASLMAGVLFFAVVSLLMVDWAKVSIGLTPLGIAAVVVPLLTGIMSLVVPRILFRQAASAYARNNAKPEIASLMRASGSAATTQTVVGMAMREGGALVGLIVWLLDSNLLGLIGAFLGLALMILTFPTSGKLEQKLADFRDEVKTQRRDA